jgi:hypothetical protein
MSFPFDALASEDARRTQAQAWEEWWQARERERAEAVESGD